MCFSAAELHKLRVKQCILHFVLSLTAWPYMVQKSLSPLLIALTLQIGGAKPQDSNYIYFSGRSVNFGGPGVLDLVNL